MDPRAADSTGAADQGVAADPAGVPTNRSPAAAVHAVHSSLSLDELRQALDEHCVAEGVTYSVQFADSRSGGLTSGPCGPGATSEMSGAAAVRMQELLASGDGRIVPVDDVMPDDGPPVIGAATLAFRGDAYGLLVIQGTGAPDIGFWQPVADALATELVKIQLYESASQESATAGAKLAALNESGDLVRYVDLEVLLTNLMERSVRITESQVGAIVLSRDGDLSAGVEWGLAEAYLKKMKTPSGESFLKTVLAERDPVLIQDPQSSDLIDATEIGEHLVGLVVVPLLTQTDTVGAIILANPEEGHLSEAAFEVLCTVANLCAAAVQNAMLYEDALNHERIEAEMNLAANVQQKLLPDRGPDRDAIELTGWNLPCDETGGDYFDFIDFGEGRTAVVIGDATGHGMGAALMMFIVRSTLRALLTQTLDLVQLAETMNDLVEEVSDDDRFMTLFIGVIDAKGENLTYVTAGHDPPIVYRDGECFEVQGTGGVPLGMLPGMSYQVCDQKLHAGDIWVFGTDGIWEARDCDGQFFGKERLMQIVKDEAAGPLPDLSDRIRTDLVAFHEGAERTDDITGVFLRVKSGDSETAGGAGA